MSESPTLLDTHRPRWKLTPLRIILVYVIAGGVWMLFSDELLNALVRNQKQLVHLEILINWLYILGTAGVLYLLIRQNLMTVQRTTEAMLKSEAQFREKLELRVMERTREIERRRKVAEGLRDMLQAINSAQHLGQVLQMIVMRAGQLLGARAAAIYRRQDAQNPSVLWVADEASSPIGTAVCATLVQRALDQTLATCHPVCITYPDGDSPANVEEGETPPCRMALGAPLLVKGEIYGGLLLFDFALHPVSDETIELLATLAEQAVLAIENSRLRAEARQAAVAAERSRLARDLHDSVTQALYSIMLYAEATNLAMQAGKQEVSANNLQELRNMAHEAMLDMRMLIFELHPPLLEEAGLVAALQARIAAVETRAGLQAEVQVEGKRRLPLQLEEEIFWIAQEALNNAAKHARAQKVIVRLTFEEHRVTLVIKDNGKGFDAANIREGGGMGMRSIEERVQRIQGRLEIESSLEVGTTLALTVNV
ncbi:MAG: GAF domain-containing sensor histidine kinase [Anaerolineae bacterium]|nr:GAF domain-containing sensor histidine kinase [Anaerolineae bacterium]